MCDAALRLDTLLSPCRTLLCTKRYGQYLTARDISRIRRHVSAAEGAYSVVEWLVMEGADVNAIDRHGRTPLEEAARNDHGEVVRLLIQHGGSVYEENKVGSEHWRAGRWGATSIRKLSRLGHGTGVRGRRGCAGTRRQD